MKRQSKGDMFSTTVIPITFHCSSGFKQHHSVVHTQGRDRSRLLAIQVGIGVQYTDLGSHGAESPPLTDRLADLAAEEQSGTMLEEGDATGGSAPNSRKRASDNVDAGHLRRGPGGSSFMTCEGCHKSVSCAVFDLHKCAESKLRDEQVERWSKVDCEHKKKTLGEAKGSKNGSAKAGANPKQGLAETKSRKSTKKARDPDMPKRASTSYILFLNDFRAKFKEENPNVKGVTEVAKAGGAKWKSMTEEEKKPYVDEAAKLKVEHAKQVRQYKLSKGLPVADDEKENASPDAAEALEGDEAEGLDGRS